MKNVYKILFIGVMALLLNACESLTQFISDSAFYQKSSKEFLKSLWDKDYNKCISYLDAWAKKENQDTLKLKLNQVREAIILNFGTEVEFSFQKSGKKFTTVEEDKLPPNSTEVLFRVSTKKEFGLFTFIYDDNSKKITAFHLAGAKWPIEEKKPGSSWFWLFGLLAMGIALFNVFAIIQIKNSSLNNKWIKYIAVLLLNVPTIAFNAESGFDFQLLHFQILLGFGYADATWELGIPLAGLYWFFKLKYTGKDDDDDNAEKSSI